MTAVRGQFEPQTRGSERRADDRRKLRLEAYGSTAAGRTDVLLLDVSTTGILLQTGADLRQGETIELELPGERGAQAVVKWSSGNLFGCEFLQPVSDAMVSAALLRSPHLLPGSQSPATDTIATDGVDDLPDAVNKLPRPVRLQVIVGTTLLIWSAIAVGAFVLLA
jgi:hypothetical protein